MLELVEAAVLVQTDMMVVMVNLVVSTLVMLLESQVDHYGKLVEILDLMLVMVAVVVTMDAVVVAVEEEAQDALKMDSLDLEEVVQVVTLDLVGMMVVMVDIKDHLL